MKSALHRYGRGFTIVELMIVVAIIALLAAIAGPAYSRSRKRAQAVRVYEDLRVLEYAVDLWAIENGKVVGDIATLSDLQPYIKTGTELYNQGRDILGNSYGNAFSVEAMPRVPLPTYASLSDVAPATFWSPYY